MIKKESFSPFYPDKQPDRWLGVVISPVLLIMGGYTLQLFFKFIFLPTVNVNTKIYVIGGGTSFVLFIIYSIKLHLFDRRRKKEMDKWIDENGSTYLKEFKSLGKSSFVQDYKALYAVERVRVDAPGFLVCVNSYINLSYKEIMPSDRGIRELKEILKTIPAARIRIIAEEISGDMNLFYPELTDIKIKGLEAIVIDGYLGEYTVIKPLFQEGVEQENAV